MLSKSHNLSEEADLFCRNVKQQTPLATAIAESKDADTSKLLSHGAERSIFVRGYSKDSLVCTLPQARQPASSAYEHPPPFLGTRPEVLDEIDTKLAAHIEFLVRGAVAQAVKANASKAAVQLPGAQAAAAAFDPLPSALKIGDRVKR
jgi:hypothetical protein